MQFISTFPKQDVLIKMQMQSINYNEFILLIRSYKINNLSAHERNTMYKFSHHTNQYEQVLTLTFKTNINCEQMAYDRNNQKLVLISDTNQIHQVDIETNKCQLFAYYGPQTYLVCNGNRLYSIDSHHRIDIYSLKNITLHTKTLETILCKFHASFEKLIHGKALYIASRNGILLFGGYYGSKFGIAMEDFEPKVSNEFWMFNISTTKWTKIDTTFTLNRFRFDAVLTSDQNYIIGMGGNKYNPKNFESQSSDDIFIIDITQSDSLKWTLIQSIVKTPASGKCMITATSGGTLTSGFIRKSNLLPICSNIVNKIALFYSEEMIHWINQYYGHYAISVSQLIASNTNCN